MDVIGIPISNAHYMFSHAQILALNKVQSLHVSQGRQAAEAAEALLMCRSSPHALVCPMQCERMALCRVVVSHLACSVLWSRRADDSCDKNAVECDRDAVCGPWTLVACCVYVCTIQVACTCKANEHCHLRGLSGDTWSLMSSDIA